MNIHCSGDEEQKWLAALEAGELDDAGQLKSERNRPLTARQVTCAVVQCTCNFMARFMDITDLASVNMCAGVLLLVPNTSLRIIASTEPSLVSWSACLDTNIYVY